MNEGRCKDRHVDARCLHPTNAIRKIVIVAVLLVGVPGVVMMSLGVSGVSGVSLMNKAQALE